jgi:hypothetical protein
MKKLLTLVLLIGTLFVGCQDEESLVEPETDNGISNSLNKFSYLDSKSNFNFTDSDFKTLGNILSDYNIVLGYTGGNVSFNYDGPNGFHAEGELIIPEDAYFGFKKFSIEFDPDNYTAHFYPSPTTFNKPLILNMKFSGLDLSEINKKEIKFYYMGENGELEKVKCEKLVVRKKKGILKIVGAELHHFSRYGWTRTK